MTPSRRWVVSFRSSTSNSGEIIFGGVGAGLYGMLVFVVLAVFIAGLMVGRTPEYLGKKDRGLRREDGHAFVAHFVLLDSWLRRLGHGEQVGARPA